MSLTGSPMMLATIVLVVLAPIGTYLLWNRVRGPRPVKFASRFALIGLCQLSAVFLSGIVLNNHYQFYASWSDLMGDTGGPGVIIHGSPAGQVSPIRPHHRGGPDPASANNGGSGNGTGSGNGNGNGGRGASAGVRPDGPPQHFSAGGDGVYVTSFTGPKTGLGGTNDIYVWTPPQYDDPAYAKTDFPVVMLFPGFPGTPNTWFGNMGGQKTLGQILAHDKNVTPFVLVAVNITPDKGINTDCSDIPGGPQVATYLTEDVRPMIERSFRVSADRTGWGMMGYSEGGLCAGKLLVQYPQYFSAAVQMSGDISPGGAISHFGPQLIDANSTLWMLQNHRPTQSIALLAAASKEDGTTLSDAFRLQQAAPDIVDVLRKDKGAHNTGVWRSWLPEAYSWLSQHLDPATPTH